MHVCTSRHESCKLSHVSFATPCTIAHQTPLSMGFSRQEHWNGLPFPSPGIFLTQGLNLHLLLVGKLFTTEPHGNPMYMYRYLYI